MCVYVCMHVNIKLIDLYINISCHEYDYILIHYCILIRWGLEGGKKMYYVIKGCEDTVNEKRE